MSQNPPLLAHLDFTAIIWAAVWAFIFSLTLMPSRRRWQLKAGQTPTPWWVVIAETLGGGVVGGVLFAIALPEIWPELIGPGKQALLSVAGSAVGPLLGRWIPQAFSQAAAFFSEKKLGFKITLSDKEDGDEHGKSSQ